MTQAVGYPETVDSKPVLWSAHRGPQSRFLASNAYEVLYGGAAGGGKTDALVFGALRQINHPKYTALILRRTFPELQELMDRALAVFPQIGGSWNEQKKRWTFASGAKITFGYCETYAEVLQYQTDEFTYIAYDQLDQVAEERIWTYLMSRNRAKAPGLSLHMRASANPGGVGGHWVKRRFFDVCPPHGTPVNVETKLFDGRSVTHSRAFVAAKIADNPTLLENDPGYADRLGLLSELEYKQLALGDWEAGGGMFYPELADPDRLFITTAQLPSLLDWHEYWSGGDWGFIHPACYGQYVRIKNVVYCLDTIFLHKYQDEEQAATVKGWADPRCLRTMYAGHDAFAKRMAHSAAAETVADVFARYGIGMERANIDREAGCKVVRRLIADPKPGPQPKDAITFRWVDTPGNRRVISEMAALIPEETHPNAPAKRDATVEGLYGDDGADQHRYAVATPSFEPQEPPPMWKGGNVETGVDAEAAFVLGEKDSFRVTSEGVIDKREYAFSGTGPRQGGFNSRGSTSDPDLDQFPE